MRHLRQPPIRACTAVFAFLGNKNLLTVLPPTHTPSLPHPLPDGSEWVLVTVTGDWAGSGSHEPERRLKAEFVLTLLLGSDLGARRKLRASLTWQGDPEVG